MKEVLEYGKVAHHYDLAKAKEQVAACPSLAAKFEVPLVNEIPMLSQVFFRNLTDDEFRVMYYLPLKIHVSRPAWLYLDRRRRVLGLKRPKHEV